MTRAMALALIFATGPSLYAPAFAQVITGELQPAWTRAFDERIEWVAPLGDAASPTLVICTSAARLLLIDAETGTHHFVQPVQAGPGVRLADGEAPGVAYCYDRFSAYALSLSSLGKLNAESGPLLWQAGEWPLPAITTRDDPEFLTRLVAAQATSRSLLVARSDGRVALLAREDGHVPRVWHFPPLPDCRLHARDRTAALVFKAPGGNSQRSAPLVHDGVKVAFFDIDRARPEPTVQTLGDTWPIWTELIPGPRLIAVWPDRVVVTGPEGPALSFAPQNEATFRASTIAVCIPRGSASTRPATRPASEPPAFLITAHDAQLHAHDLLTGEQTWAATAAWPSKPPVTALRVHRDLLITMTTDSFDVRDATSAEMLGDFGAGERARLVTATVRRDFAYGLFRDYPADQGTGRGPGLFLASVRLPGPGAELSTQPWHLYPSGYRLETPAPFRQAVWAGRHLVLVEPNGLQAYTLP